MRRIIARSACLGFHYGKGEAAFHLLARQTGSWERERGGAHIIIQSPSMKRFRGGLVFKAHRLLYHSILGMRVIMKKKKVPACSPSRGTIDNTPTKLDCFIFSDCLIFSGILRQSHLTVI